MAGSGALHLRHHGGVELLVAAGLDVPRDVLAHAAHLHCTPRALVLPDVEDVVDRVAERGRGELVEDEPGAGPRVGLIALDGVREPSRRADERERRQ